MPLDARQLQIQSCKIKATLTGAMTLTQPISLSFSLSPHEVHAEFKRACCGMGNVWTYWA